MRAIKSLFPGYLNCHLIPGYSTFLEFLFNSRPQKLGLYLTINFWQPYPPKYFEISLSTFIFYMWLLNAYMPSPSQSLALLGLRKLKTKTKICLNKKEINIIFLKMTIYLIRVWHHKTGYFEGHFIKRRCR